MNKISSSRRFPGPLLALAGITLLTLLGCGGSSGGGDDFRGETPPREEAPPTAPNPITSTQNFGENGNLYKPESDEHAAGLGNLVVLFSAGYTTQFDSCEARKNDGSVEQLICINNQPWTQIPFSCFSNGGRQTWRANFQCHDMAEVKVICRDANQEITFTVAEALRGQVCTRFG